MHLHISFEQRALHEKDIIRAKNSTWCGVKSVTACGRVHHKERKRDHQQQFNNNKKKNNNSNNHSRSSNSTDNSNGNKFRKLRKMNFPEVVYNEAAIPIAQKPIIHNFSFSSISIIFWHGFDSSLFFFHSIFVFTSRTEWRNISSAKFCFKRVCAFGSSEFCLFRGPIVWRTQIKIYVCISTWWWEMKWESTYSNQIKHHHFWILVCARASKRFSHCSIFCLAFGIFRVNF